MLDTFRQKDKERILRFIEESEIDHEKLNLIIDKFILTQKYSGLKNNL